MVFQASDFDDALLPLVADEAFQSHAETARAVQSSCVTSLNQLLRAAHRTIASGGRLLLFGNGGSAADAQHIAAELTIRYRDDRAPIAAIALTTDTSALTACANDFSFDHVFARQVEAIGQAGDLAIGISTSGNSPNVLEALKIARAAGMTAAGLTGRSGGAMRGLADPLIMVPSSVTARIQEMHILLGHIFCESLERSLGMVNSP